MKSRLRARGSLRGQRKRRRRRRGWRWGGGWWWGMGRQPLCADYAYANHSAPVPLFSRTPPSTPLPAPSHPSLTPLRAAPKSSAALKMTTQEELAELAESNRDALGAGLGFWDPLGCSKSECEGGRQEVSITSDLPPPVPQCRSGLSPTRRPSATSATPRSSTAASPCCVQGFRYPFRRPALPVAVAPGVPPRLPPPPSAASATGCSPCHCVRRCVPRASS